MTQQLYHEYGEIISQTRALLEHLQDWGFESLPSDSIGMTESPQPPVVLGADPVALAQLEEQLRDCSRCSLSRERNQVVFGVGNPRAQLVLVGEAPGREEDRQGVPFVGEAGQLLDRMLFAMGLSRKQVYICNVIKCRPPNNRDPQPEEIACCEPFLRQQLALIRPRLIVSLGRFAAQSLLRSSAPIGKMRGRWHEYEGIALMPTFHPAYLLRNPASKREVWSDLKQVRSRLAES